MSDCLVRSRPKSEDITLSLLRRAKAAGFTALVITLDTNVLGWRTHDVDASYVPFIHGVGGQAGFSDPVYMGRCGETPITDDDVPEFPYDYKEIDRKIKAGDAKLKKRMELGAGWIAETMTGVFRDWEDLKFMRKNWDGPIVLKGIQSVEVRFSTQQLWRSNLSRRFLVGCTIGGRAWNEWHSGL